MTTKVLTGTYTAGYTLQAPVTTLIIARGAIVEDSYMAVATPSSATGSYSVVNHGFIEGVLPGSYGILLAAGGSVTNGGPTDTQARIFGYTPIKVESGVGTVLNFGTIRVDNASNSGIYLRGSGGSVTNGSAADTTALIAAAIFVNSAPHQSAPGTLTNFGRIVSGSQTYYTRVFFGDGGQITNGSSEDTGALIQGGVRIDGASGTVTNFGTIGYADYKPGVQLNQGGAVTNGAVSDTKALIVGEIGVFQNNGSPVTVTNFGTIEGADGGAAPDKAILFKQSGSELVVEAGSSFIGAIYGGGGTLDLASGVGTLTGLLSNAGDVIVSGSMATTTFQNFGTVEVDVGATFTDSGAVTIAAGQTVTDAGTLTLGGTGVNSIVNAGLIGTSGAGVLTLAGAVENTGTLAANGGTLIVKGAVTLAGVATIDGGTLDLASSFTENVIFSGTSGVLELARSRTYAGTITGFSTTGNTRLDLRDIGFVSSAEATYSGTSKSGVLTVTDGTHTANIHLIGDYLGTTFVARRDGHGGTIVVDHRAKTASAPPAHTFIDAMAALAGAGGGATHASPAWAPREPMLAGPRTMIA